MIDLSDFFRQVDIGLTLVVIAGILTFFLYQYVMKQIKNDHDHGRKNTTH